MHNIFYSEVAPPTSALKGELIPNTQIYSCKSTGDNQLLKIAVSLQSLGKSVRALTSSGRKLIARSSSRTQDAWQNNILPLQNGVLVELRTLLSLLLHQPHINQLQSQTDPIVSLPTTASSDPEPTSSGLGAAAVSLNDDNYDAEDALLDYGDYDSDTVEDKIFNCASTSCSSSASNTGVNNTVDINSSEYSATHTANRSPISGTANRSPITDPHHSSAIPHNSHLASSCTGVNSSTINHSVSTDNTTHNPPIVCPLKGSNIDGSIISATTSPSFDSSKLKMKILATTSNKNKAQAQSNFHAFVATFIKAVDQGFTPDEIKRKLAGPIDMTLMATSKHLNELNAVLADHKYVLNRKLNDSKSVKFRKYPLGTPEWFTNSQQCLTLMRQSDLISDPKVLKGLSARRRLQLLDRACIDHLISYRALKHSINKLARSLHPTALLSSVKTDTRNQISGYDLDAMHLTHLKRNIKRGHHLTPDTAFGAMLPHLDLSDSMAIIDSGATKHFVTPYFRPFLQRKRHIQCCMVNANGKTTPLSEGGDLSIDLLTSTGTKLGSLPLTSANVIPDAGVSLLSLMQLRKEGATFLVTPDQGSFICIDGAFFKLLEKANLMVIDLSAPLISCSMPQFSQITDTVFYSADIDESFTNESADATETTDTAFVSASASMDTWHQRLGHADKSRINFLNKSGTGLGLNIIGQQPHNAKCKCIDCLRTNNITREMGKFREFADTVSRKGELITSDVVGPFPPTPEGHRYAISFIDEFSRHSTVYFLKRKSEATDALLSLILYYRSLNILIGSIRTDQGGEYGGHNERPTFNGTARINRPLDSKEFFTPAFDAACLKNNIQHVLTPAHRPELHAVAERWNRTVMTMANAMLYKARCSPLLWSSAVAHANHIRNRLPTRTRGGLTPFEIFTNRRPRYDNLRVWGCYCYKYIHGLQKTPGLPVRKRLIYVGESTDRIGFRCFDEVTFSFSTEYELIFDEAGINDRAVLLEAFDNRRQLLRNEDIMSILIIANFDHDNEFQRTVYLPSDRPVAASSPATLNVPDITGNHSSSSAGLSDFSKVDSITHQPSRESELEGVINPLTDESIIDSGAVTGEPIVGEVEANEPIQHEQNPNVRRSNRTRTSPNMLSTRTLGFTGIVSNNTSDMSHSNVQSDNTIGASSTVHHDLASQVSLDVNLDPSLDQSSLLSSPTPTVKIPTASANNVTAKVSFGPTSTPVTDTTSMNSASAENSLHKTYNSHAITGVLGKDITLDDFDDIEALLQDASHTVDNMVTVVHDSPIGTALSQPSALIKTDNFYPDVAADIHGPLLAEIVQPYLDRAAYSFDADHLRCPQRYLPVGIAEPVTPEVAKFIKLAKTHNLHIKIQQENPKQLGSDSLSRYDATKAANTVDQYYRLHSYFGTTPFATKDLNWDYRHGYISFPRNTSESDLVQNDSVSHQSLMAIKAKDATTQSSASSHHEIAIPSIDQFIEDDLTAPAIAMTANFHNLLEEIWPRDVAPSHSEINSRDASASAMIAELISDTGFPDPNTFRAATDPLRPDRQEWLASIHKETSMLLERKTWSYVLKKSLPHYKRPIKCKFVFKKKFVKDNSIQYKSRLVACGYSQQAGYDYASDELYASVCSYSSMRYLMSLATQKGFFLYQTDIQGAYLESHLEDELYMDVPPNLPKVDKDGNELVCKIHRGLYGLKQSGYAWSQCFKHFMLTDPEFLMGFTAMSGEPNLYRKSFTLNGVPSEIYVGQYVDDCLLAASSKEVLDWFLASLSKRFPVNPASSGYITWDKPGLLLSMHVRYDQEKGILQFDQQRAINLLAQKFKVNGVTDGKSLPIRADINLPKLNAPEHKDFPNQYLSMIGSCLHICQVSRPDCAFAVGTLSRHSATPGQQHMDAAKDLIAYMYSTRQWCIQYKRSDMGNTPHIFERSWHPDDDVVAPATRTIEQRLISGEPNQQANFPDTFIDSDLGGDKITRKSTSGLVIMMNGGPIAWNSRLQKLCAQSSAEAEIYAVVESVKEALHVKLLCEESGIRQPGLPMTIWEDNNACIQMGHNLRGSNAAKHYELRLRFLNEHIHENNIEFSRVDTSKQLADGFTKPLPLPAFRIFRNLVMFNTNQIASSSI